MSNHHAKLPDLSRALSDVTLSVLVTKVPLVVAPDNQTHPQEARSAHLKPLSQPFVPPKNKELHFLLANDALIVQVNKLALFLSPMNNKEFGPSLFLFVCGFTFFFLR